MLLSRAGHSIGIAVPPVLRSSRPRTRKRWATLAPAAEADAYSEPVALPGCQAVASSIGDLEMEQLEAARRRAGIRVEDTDSDA